MKSSIPRESYQALLAPRSIAVMGASGDPSKAGGRPIAYLKALRYQGGIYPVNPARSEIAGLRCYPNLAAIGAPVDLCVITLPANQVEAALQECVAAKVPAAVVFSSGFAEVGAEGRALQDRMRDLAEQNGIALCGPNCLGLISVAAKAAATFTTALERRPDLPFGHVGFISQSGAIAAFILALMQDQGLGLSHFITTGNEASLGFTDYALHLLDEPEVRVIAGYVEGLARDDLVALAGKAREKKKPLVLMKVGASAAGARASLAHTGNLVGNDAAYAAAFRQFGIVRPQSVDELLDFSHVLAISPLPRGTGAGIITISGGAGILMADWCEASGLDVVPLAADTVNRLKPVAPWFATPANPLDTTGRRSGMPACWSRRSRRWRPIPASISCWSMSAWRLGRRCASRTKSWPGPGRRKASRSWSAGCPKTKPRPMPACARPACRSLPNRCGW
ncbi:MAG: CoA-binding protein [Alphaproteobacteria bacterium]